MEMHRKVSLIVTHELQSAGDYARAATCVVRLTFYTALEENEILGEGDIATVLDELLPAQNKSRYIGLALKVPEYIVEAIHQRCTNPQDCLYHVLLEILKRTDPIPTWLVIANALKSRLVDFPKLAHDIQKKYCSSFSSVCGGASGSTKYM